MQGIGLCNHDITSSSKDTMNRKKKKNGVVGSESLVPGYKWIVINQEYLGGRPSVLGKRMSVAMILEDMSKGWTIDDMVREFDLSKESILEALRYGAEHLNTKVETDVAS